MFMSSATMSLVSSSIPMQSSSIITKEQNIIPNATPSSLSSSSSSSSSSSIGIRTIPKKPQRPLTAYHIFFQIEREYIIQTMDGDVADKAMTENKILHDDVPQRYKNIKLMPDWYAGPGKRKKRKHRKQHGKIGFLELSKIISTRWAQLEQVDPETKTYVTKIAKSEVAEYYKEMGKYKELIKDIPASALPPKKTNKKRTMQQQKQQQRQMSVSPDSMISSYRSMPPMPAQLTQDIDFFLSQLDGNKQNTLSLPSQLTDKSLEESTQAFTFEQQGSTNKKMKFSHPQEHLPTAINTITPMKNDMQSMLPRRVSDRSRRSTITEAFDSFKNNQPLNIDMSIVCQPVGTTMKEDRPPLKRRPSTVSLTSLEDILNSPSSEEVDLCDDEILQLWASNY